jgi:hypothetical protein
MGIDGRSPKSPILQGLDTLPIHAPYHTIVGARDRGDTPNSSDSVVAYWISHLAEAKSELIVPGPHGSYALPQTVSELKWILRLRFGQRRRSHELDYHAGETWPGRLLELGSLCTRTIFTAWLTCSTFSGLFRTVTGLI